MPRPKKPGAGEPKRRSRNGCWPCKTRKVKCGEEKPRCLNCERQGETCDYSIRLNWGGRTKRRPDTTASETSSTTNSPHMSTFSFEDDPTPLFSPATPEAPAPPRKALISHARAPSAASAPTSEPSVVDPQLMRLSQAPSQQMLAAEGAYEQAVQDQTSKGLPAPRMDLRLQSSQFRPGLDYPSPSGSSFEALNLSHAGFPSTTTDPPLSPPAMLPPMRGHSYNSPRLFAESTESVYKRRKRSQSAESPAASASASLSTPDAYSPNPGPPTPFSPFPAMPLTPNSVGADEAITRTALKPGNAVYPPPDLRRLSVQSLLAGPPGEYSSGYSSDTQQSRQYPMGDSDTTTYGYDMGYPDMDTPKNNDTNAIAIFSPPSGAMVFDDDSTYGNAEIRGKDMAFEKGGYYAKPVPIKISKSLEPLPPLLLENPMNLLYFHHFLNHTARILVPHDCEQNPFRQILPEMAVRDENILNLLLAFSASHRARLLSHPEPVNRIALWVRDLFPKMRSALTTSPSHISNSTLAPAIMMASLEIISPNTFEVPISWQNHLTIARQMIIARGGPRSMVGNKGREDRVAYFLSRWFAYLDVLGSLSGNKNDEPLGSFYWSSENATKDEDYQIDCLMGFTTRCVGILARIAELAKQVEPLRIDEDGNIRKEWKPSGEVVARAEVIERDLEEGLREDIVYKGCNHHTFDPSASESETTWDSTEIYATNEMFHWAGLIHLYRRILSYPPHHASVQHCVSQILGLLYKVRRGSTAEACLLFPMFAAGCASLDVGQREKILERVGSVEGFGMTQVKRAKRVMVRVWETGKEWESLVDGEFLG